MYQKESLPLRRRTWRLDPEWASEVLGDLRDGLDLPDKYFDKLFSPQARFLSNRHWTPIEIAKRAAQLLSDGKARRILDVGAGVGKFCIVGALTTPSTFFGVEQRGWLAQEARTLIGSLNISRATVRHADMREMDWQRFDAFYLYNPFYEHAEECARLDNSVELRTENFFEYVGWVKDRLVAAPEGTRVVTFHGFGGELPPGYRLRLREARGDDFLELWVKEHMTEQTTKYVAPIDDPEDEEIPFTD